MKGYYPLIIVTLAMTMACANAAQNFPPHPVDKHDTNSLLQTAIEAYHLAEKLKPRGDKMKVSKKGLHYANTCLEEDPDNVGCYYYKALNTGVYYQARVLGYRKGLKIMVRSAEKVIALNPQYEYAGGYRFLGRLYGQVPAFNMGEKAVRKDLDKSIRLLSQAIKIAPDYPENHLFLAESLWEHEQGVEALAALDTMQQLEIQSTWKSMATEWQRTAKKLRKKIRKVINLDDTQVSR
jgi:tetratricopeptide (TPR) repeat protein